jgi:phospholipid-translocating ATPase
MYNGDTDEEEKDTKIGLPKDLPPVYVKSVTSAGESDAIPLENITLSPTSTNGDHDHQRHEPPYVGKATTSSSTPVNNPPASSDSNVTVHFHDAELARDLLTAVHADQDSTNAAHARQLNGFFSVLALCHTVLTSVHKETGKIEYKAQSPDESALVQAAADMGFVFKGREKEVLLLQTPFGGAKVGGPEDGDEIIRDSQYSSSTPGEGSLERYELLNILEFTSARKRMSVVLRKLDGDDSRLFLLSKGADNVIFERLKQGAGDELKQVTEKHLDEFASQGLRTLTLAYKIIRGESFFL